MARVRASAQYVRIAPRKVRLVADLIRGQKVSWAQAQLRFLTKRGANPMLKLLNSAIASAKNRYDVNLEAVKIVRLTVDEGPKLKRWRARARGVAYQIQKKSSHITLELEVGDVAQKAEQVKKEATLIKEEESVKKSTAETNKPKRADERMGRVERRKGGMGRIFRRKAI